MTQIFTGTIPPSIGMPFSIKGLGTPQPIQGHIVGAPTGMDTTSRMIREGAMTVLGEYTDASRLTKTEPTLDALGAKGFVVNQDSTQYLNPRTGEKIKVTTDPQTGNKNYEYEDGNIKHTMVYDKNGKAMSGSVQVKEENGSTTTINYSYDEKGNKVIGDVTQGYNHLIHC